MFRLLACLFPVKIWYIIGQFHDNTDYRGTVKAQKPLSKATLLPT